MRLAIVFVLLTFFITANSQVIKYDLNDPILEEAAQTVSELLKSSGFNNFDISLKVKKGSTGKMTASNKSDAVKIKISDTDSEKVAARLMKAVEEIIRSTYIFEELGGKVAVEAEHYATQRLYEVRKWYIVDEKAGLFNLQDVEETHFENASNNAYLKILPDTRRSQKEELIEGENFSNTPGKLGVLEYKVFFNNPGKYYVWVRAYSTGSEDNGLHVGMDGTWVESGQRMQWCEGKSQWTWASRQRTPKQHCGVEQMIFLDVPSAGLHTISFSMCKDGFEFDKFVLSKIYKAPVGVGIKEKYKK